MLPSQSRVVIIGGGIMGCGLAYHLAHQGWTDVVLLEKAELTSGSTWHAAGQITHSTSSFSLGRCVGYNIELYSEVLEKETGQSVSWHGCGSFRLAYTEDEDPALAGVGLPDAGQDLPGVGHSNGRHAICKDHHHLKSVGSLEISQREPHGLL